MSSTSVTLGPTTPEIDLGPYQRGDTRSFGFTFTKSDGSAQPIGGWKLYLTIKNALSDADAQAAFKDEVTNHDNATNGETSIAIPSGKTKNLDGTYYYDFQVKKSDDSVQTIMKGRIEFDKDATVRTD